MNLPTLYSRATTGALRQWTIEINETGYRTHSGQIGGKTTTSKWYTVEATNVGRANERTIEEQAKFEAQAKWQKKIDAGYTESESDVDADLSFVTPMLAKKWEDRKSRVKYPLYSQPKLDGMRAVITKDGAKTRNGKPWLTIPHILDALKPLFKEFNDLVLDGELYNHEFKHDFNKICSLAKKTKPTDEDLKETAEKLQFHWYDIGESKSSFSDRMLLIEKLSTIFNFDEDSCIQIVPTHKHHNEKSLDHSYDQFISEGYEGQMIRLDEPYEFKRSASLLKRKEFQDDEYLIVDIREGKGNKAGMAGYAILEREDGKRFHSNIKGQFDFLKDLLENKKKYIGTYGTCMYFNLTPDGIPRFPYLIRLREGKSQD